jgi:hypothetical protein
MALQPPGPTSPPLVLENFADSLNRNTDWFRDIYEFAPEEYSKLCKVENTNMWFKINTGVQGIAKPQPNRDMQPVPLRSPVRSNNSTMIQQEYRSGLLLERLMFEAPTHPEPMDNVRDFIQSEVTLRDQVMANVFNNGFSVQTYDFVEYGGSKVELFSTAHKYENGVGTYSNFLNINVPPNITTLYQIMSTIKAYKDNVGNFINMMGDFTIMVPVSRPDWLQGAAAACLSPDNPDTANRAINTMQRDFNNVKYEAINNFTSSTKWFVRIGTEQRAYPIRMYVFSAPNMSPLAQVNGLNVDAWGSRMRSIFAPGLFGSARGVFAVGV